MAEYLEKSNNINILIVEDSPTQSEILQHILENAGYKVIVANDGEEALVILDKTKPNIVVSDIIMPKLDGFQLCRKIKEDKNLNDIPVILLTSLSDPNDIIKGLECGADNFVNKPYDEQFLLHRIEHLLANRQALRAEKTATSMEIYFGDIKYNITSDRPQILNLLLSTYETAVKQNLTLIKTQKELNRLNDSLELKVEKRTETLKEEFAERKRIEADLRKSEEQFRAFYNDASIGLYRTTPDGKIIMANKVLINMLGFTSFEELSKRDLTKSGFDPSCLRQEFVKQIEKNGEVKDLEGKWICFDGTVICVRESAKVFRDPNGKPKYYDGVVENVTERRQVEKELQESEERFRTIANILPVGIFRTDINGDTTYVNPTWCKLSGLSFEESFGNNWLKTVHSEDREKLRKGWEESTKLHSTFFAEYRFSHSNGVIKWVMEQAVPEMNSKNEIIGYIGTITDITQHVQSEITKSI